MTLPLVLLAGVVASGCGGGGDDGGGGDLSADAVKGRPLFISSCGSCHTLADAETSGRVGPELDGVGYDVERVKAQIERGGGAMPPRLVTGAEADAVAAYVAEASGP